MNSWVLLSFPTKRACVLSVSSGTTACSIDERLLSTSPRSESRQATTDSAFRYVAPRIHDHRRKFQKSFFDKIFYRRTGTTRAPFGFLSTKADRADETASSAQARN